MTKSDGRKAAPRCIGPIVVIFVALGGCSFENVETTDLRTSESSTPNLCGYPLKGGVSTRILCPRNDAGTTPESGTPDPAGVDAAGDRRPVWETIPIPLQGGNDGSGDPTSDGGVDTIPVCKLRFDCKREGPLNGCRCATDGEAPNDAF